MSIENMIMINQFGQDFIPISVLQEKFESMDNIDRRLLIRDILNLIIQSKPIKEDIQVAIMNSNLKKTYTPCIMLKKGIEPYLLEKIVSLPNNELLKVFMLFLSLFRLAYQRRFKQEFNNPNKWWYWDLTNPNNTLLVLERYKN